MSEIDPRELLADIIGQPCESATNPHGSILSLDFGELGTNTSDDPAAIAHGWRHLTILSPWRLQAADEVICDWNADGGSNSVISKAIAPLKGRSVASATTAPPAWDMTIQFTGDVQLLVFGDSNNDRDDAWFILGTDGKECGAVPRMRAAD